MTTPNAKSIKANAVDGTAHSHFSETVQQAMENMSAQNPLNDFRPGDLLDTGKELADSLSRHPGALAVAARDFRDEVFKGLTGRSSLEPAPGDRRFSDDAWRTNPLFAGLKTSYLALNQSMITLARHAELEGRQAERAEFLMQQIADALAPTNFLLSNPVALRRAAQTKGMSVLRGLGNLANDIAKRRPLPAQTDDSAFEVGRNLAATPGKVVFRNEMFELIQYSAQTAKVHQRPIVVVPSIVNKYYVLDLAPGRSLFEYFIGNGLTLYTIVWRNPQPQHDYWGLGDYRDSMDSAIEVARQISGTNDVNLWAVCAAAPLAVSLVAYYKAAAQHKVNSLMLVVAPLDLQAMMQGSTLGAFAGESLQKSAPATASRMRGKGRKRLSARELTQTFAMLRPNDLIWPYWVNNYLMGEKPSAFDVLYWNADATGMTARYNEDFSEMVKQNPLLEPGKLKVRGRAIADIADLGVDSYVIGARTDHLCAWPVVYRSAQLLGARCQFVLGNSGHIQTLVCPPGNSKAGYWTHREKPETPEAWLDRATHCQGSWWEHCLAWTQQRAGPLRLAPRTAGSKQHPPLGDAPGRYVFEKS